MWQNNKNVETDFGLKVNREFDKINVIKKLYVTGETRTNREGAYSVGMAVRLG